MPEMTVTVVQDSMMDPEHRPGQEYSVDVVMPHPGFAPLIFVFI